MDMKGRLHFSGRELLYRNVLKPMQIALLQHTDSEQICHLFQFVPAISEAVVSHTFHQNNAVCIPSSKKHYEKLLSDAYSTYKVIA